MNYIGVIIEESLSDKSILDQIKILETRVENVTEKHKTPWLKKWTLHKVEIPKEKVEEISNKLSSSLQKDYWFADYKNDKFHYIIFNSKAFKADLSNPQSIYKQAKDYGISLGIPEYQVAFGSF